MEYFKKFWDYLFNWSVGPPQVDRQLAKRVNLTNKLAVVFTVLVWSYIPIFLLMEAPVPTVMVFIIGCLYATVLITNRLGKYNAARLLFLTVVNGILVAWSAILGKQAGIHYMAFIWIGMPLVIYQLKDKWQIVYGIVMTHIAMATVELMARFDLYPPLAPLPPIAELILYESLIELAFIVIIFIILYFYIGNERSEKELEAINQRMEEAYNTLEQRQRVIEDNLNYAHQLQKSILPSERQMSRLLPDHFVLWYPKDVVGGDFYWIHHDDDTPRTMVALVDCTGHGVPGAFMSMLGNSLLKMVAAGRKIEKPGIVLEEMNTEIQGSFQSDADRTGRHDGMVASLCIWQYERESLLFAGAKQSIIIADSQGVSLIKGDNKTLGGFQRKVKPPVTSHHINVKPDTTIYMTTDGLIDQNGKFEGQDLEKLGARRLLGWIEKNHHRDLSEQKVLLTRMIKELLSSEEQLDDITIIAFRPRSPRTSTAIH